MSYANELALASRETMATDRSFDAFYGVHYGRLVVQLFAVTGNWQDAEFLSPDG